jgi:hypothetical protein
VANIRHWLEAAEAEYGEQIEAIIVGHHYGYKPLFLPDEGVLLSREAGLAKLDAEYNNGPGGAGCFPMYAWSPAYVFFIHEYDGHTSLASVHRHPTAFMPSFAD